MAHTSPGRALSERVGIERTLLRASTKAVDASQLAATLAPPSTEVHRRARTDATRMYGEIVTREALGSTTPVHLRWVAHHDEHTRPSHRAADGQTRPPGSPFAVGTTWLRHPGDSAGSPDETINCRCVLVLVPGAP